MEHLSPSSAIKAPSLVVAGFHAPVVKSSPLPLHKMSACMAVAGDIINVILPQIPESMLLLGSLV